MTVALSHYSCIQWPDEVELLTICCCPGAFCLYRETDRALNIGLFKINVHCLKHCTEHKSDSVTQDRLARFTPRRDDGSTNSLLKAKCVAYTRGDRDKMEHIYTCIVCLIKTCFQLLITIFLYKRMSHDFSPTPM